MAGGALLVLSPLFFLVCILIWLDSKGSPFFFHERVGKDMKPFRLIKFRSMAHREGASRGLFNPGDGSRRSRFGNLLRKTKVDELPELFNVLIGDMAIIGPRPEVEKYVQVYDEDFKEILKVRPGLSDYASIKYRNEEHILALETNPEHYYREVILPDKLRLAKRYLDNLSFKTDLQIVSETIKSLLAPDKEERQEPNTLNRQNYHLDY